MNLSAILRRIQGDRRILVGAVVIVAVVLVVTLSGDDSETYSLCDLATLQSDPLLADDESDTALIAERLSQRADRIESARSGQTPEVSAALTKIAEAIREVADLAGSGGEASGLAEAVDRLSSDTELVSANDVVSKAVSEQCSTEVEPTTPTSIPTTVG